MEREFIIWTVLPYLDNNALHNLLASSKQMRAYDTIELWKSRLDVSTSSRVDIKKMLHVKELLLKYDPRILAGEIYDTRQWKLFTTVLRKSCCKTVFVCILKMIEHGTNLPSPVRRRLVLDIGRASNNFKTLFGQYRKLLNYQTILLADIPTVICA